MHGGSSSSAVGSSAAAGKSLLAEAVVEAGGAEAFACIFGFSMTLAFLVARNALSSALREVFYYNFPEA